LKLNVTSKGYFLVRQFHQHFTSSFFHIEVFFPLILFTYSLCFHFWNNEIGIKLHVQMLVMLFYWYNFTNKLDSIFCATNFDKKSKLHKNGAWCKIRIIIPPQA
jgi:hypothetical protein